MLAKGQRFEGARISLDGSSFYDCVFARCTLIYSGVLPVVMDNNRFDDCAWEFQGPATNTMSFLKAVYSAGASQLVEQTFESIRSRS